MASTLISTPITNSDRARDSSRRKKKKKIQAKQDHQQQQEAQSHTKWKSEAQQQLYSSKLLQALSQVSINPPNNANTNINTNTNTNTNANPSSSSPPRRGRAVREAADRVLAVAAKGRTRWSRAILTSRLKIKFRQHKRQRSAAAASGTGSTRPRKPKFSVYRLKGKGLPAVQKKVRVLGRLVPGCRKQPLPVILEEATDYIAALEMQVRAMSRLAQLLSGSTSGAAGST
ncbi:transcription factor bHLH147 [Prunus yedoensis var. nudiflora]|uniref:Transcription factor bHLH147 n=1 Tax=Prunus yedoensis var. nudiflora TaxID=2094558 RepID=A0A314ZQD9_PRUYE|nr:transcription factor bHLH147 [Prunus yedoensis var. nudiflora]